MTVRKTTVRNVFPSLLTRVLTGLLLDAEVFKHFSDVKFGPHLYGIFANGRVESWVESRPLDPPEMGKVSRATFGRRILRNKIFLTTFTTITQTSPVDFQKLIAQQVARMHDLDMTGDGQPCLWRVSRYNLDIQAMAD